MHNHVNDHRGPVSHQSQTMRSSSAIVLAVITALTSSISAVPAQNPAGAAYCGVPCSVNSDCTTACPGYKLCLNENCVQGH
ncbi:uncharacterized protein F5147DRAFT_666121 [Suillus discolor]|uniref:Uncharacterized protein n=1 Tax=Suillus discolor TaxID=1912936 RepID=A0A9P7FJS2_9AGAM|nr:uncharacterized protein F5147DRAFT_666121 [Suillus discolor]KAG2118650.1 hypothetical protein F5147DRAFT_666121 [Suillus discolor]